MAQPALGAAAGDIKSALVQCYHVTVSPTDSAALSQAEATLKALSRQPEFTINTLKVVQDKSIGEPVRLAAAVNFKNIVKSSWAPTDTAQVDVIQIQESERGEIKLFLVTLMLQSEVALRKQLSAALSIIADQDYPHNWTSLLPELTVQLESPDINTVVGVLDTIASVFRTFRTSSIDACNDKLDVSQRSAAAPVLLVAQKMEAAAASAKGDRATLKLVCDAVRLCNEIVFSLNTFGLSLHMAELAQGWMQVWMHWLKFSAPIIAESDTDVESSEDAVKATICHNCLQFLEMQEEDIAPHLETFVTTVWGLLVGCTPNKGQDNLAMSAIAFLTSVCRSTHYKLFASGDTIKQICQGIIIPNVRLRPEDEEDFEFNHKEYLRRDLEGSDSDTRRRAAADFVRCLVENFPTETTNIMTGYIGTLLAEYAADADASWRTKNCAVYMVMALAVKGRTAASGATRVNDLVDIEQFCDQHVLPELLTESVDTRPVLKADSLRYLCLFRSKISKAKLLAAFPSIVRLIQATNNTLHSYAAITVERLLALNVDGAPLLQPADVSAHLQQLLHVLFGALALPDSTENEYLIKCVMRVIMFVGPQIAPVAGACLDWLTVKLLAVCKNPVFAGFNHYLFESVAALVVATATDAATLKSLEDKIFPCFDVVLQQDVVEFHPYIFQVFALIIVSTKELRPDYMTTMLPLFLRHDFWEKKGNVPALSMLLQAYLLRAAPEIVAKGNLQNVLGIFQKLLSTPKHFADAYALLSSILAYVPLQELRQYLPQIFKLLYGPLTGPTKSTKNTVAFMVTLSKLVCWHGTEATVAALEGAQAGSSGAIFTQVFSRNLVHVRGRAEKRAVGIALTHVLCEHAPLLAASDTWQQMVLSLVQFIAGAAAAADAEEADNSALQETLQDLLEYSNEFSKLSNAQVPPPPVCPEVASAGPLLGKLLAELSHKHPGTVEPLLVPWPQEWQAKLNEFVQAGGVALA